MTSKAKFLEDKRNRTKKVNILEACIKSLIDEVVCPRFKESILGKHQNWRKVHSNKNGLRGSEQLIGPELSANAQAP